jgi:hypothetical protein
VQRAEQPSDGSACREQGNLMAARRGGGGGSGEAADGAQGAVGGGQHDCKWRGGRRRTESGG